MNKRKAKSEAWFLVSLWVRSALDEGALESRIEYSGLDSTRDGDRLRDAMAEALGRIEVLGSKPIDSADVWEPHYGVPAQQKGLGER